MLISNDGRMAAFRGIPFRGEKLDRVESVQAKSNIRWSI